MHIFGNDVTSPGSASQSQCNRHTIVIVAAVAIGLHLVDHDTAYANTRRQFLDMFLISAVNATGMAITTKAGDVSNQ